MRTETTTRTLYQFDELGDQAKENARDWYRGLIDADDFEFVIDDAVNMAALLGIEISSRNWVNSYGTTPNIFWSGFCSQGDGACFEGFYSYKKGAPAAIKKETGAGRPDASDGDKELLRIAEALQALQKKAFYRLTAEMKHQGHYSHSGCMDIGVYSTNNRYANDEEHYGIKQLMRDFADWIYSQLDKENDWLNSNECIDENITANEYEFAEDGRRA
jgi:hypothetical protein